MFMPNPWILHVQKYAKENNVPYNRAITEAKNSYKKPEKAEKKEKKDKKANQMNK